LIDTAMLRLRGPSGECDLTATELRILSRLAVSPGAVVSTADLIDAAWPGVSAPATLDAALRMHLARLRTKLEDVGLGRDTIDNRHGHGYVLIPPLIVSLDTL
jgi:DNA-binding response OmpR family regulator